MVVLTGYEDFTQIHHSANSNVYRARRVSNGQPVVLKVFNRDYPTPEQIRRYKQEYHLTCQLNAPGIIKAYGLEECQKSYAIILEDFGGLSLKQWLKQHQNLSVSEFLLLAIAATESLGQIHAQNIIHKDINPSNIIFNPSTQELKIIDFGISSQLSRENPTLKNPNFLEGTLAYISPEQTGRMNRSLDYRTDFYSLGITFYEMLTGKLPFNKKDPLDLIHCHIAKSPPPIIHKTTEKSKQDEEKIILSSNLKTGKEIPPIIIEIVMKLLAKNAEDRYQNSLGLKYDLERCLQQLETNTELEIFELGERDLCDRFLIPEKLYGRENEVQILLNAFERVTNGSTELMLVAGFSGIGKTAVVNEIHKPIVKQRGYFIKGKFDQFNRNIPFSGFVQAFRELMGQLLGESDTNLATWKAKILKALGDNGQVLIDVIPELERIVGKQRHATQLSGTAAQNRFNLLFQKFAAVFTTPEHPLLIFLDDLQWADSASLNLMKVLMDDSNTGYLLLLGAYRDNEVFPTHPLMLGLAELKKKSTISTINLKKLSLNHINQLTAETLSCSKDLTQPLAELVYQKTQGNPFFTTQFLKGLYEENLITFNLKLGYWECDLVQVCDAALTDDVVAFMAGRLQKLPEETQSVLKLAACIGNQFDLETLAIVSEHTEEEIAKTLWSALQEGLVLPMSESYKFFQEYSRTEQQTADAIWVGYRFLHDRVQQAAYSLIPFVQQRQIHFRIGQELKKYYAYNPEEKLFEVINHLNLGCCFINTNSDREELARLNCVAVRKALNSTAHKAAIEYFKKGISLLNYNCWYSQYSITLELHKLAVQAYYLSGEYQQMDSIVQLALNNTSSLLDKIPIYELQIQALISQNNQQLALDLGLEVLGLLKVRLIQERPIHQDNIEALIEHPTLQNPKIVAALRLLTNIITPAWTLSPKFFKETILTMVSLSFEFGMCTNSAFGFAWYATWLCESLGDINSGYRFGKLAMQLVERFDAKSLRSSVCVLFATHVGHWKEHVQQCLPIHIQGLESGLETGNLEYACYGAAEYGQYLFLTGKSLTEVESDCRQKLQIIKKLNQDFHIQYLAPWHQGILNLISDCLDKIDELVGESYDEANYIEAVIRENQLTLGFSIFFVKMFLAYLFYQYEKAVNFGEYACRYTAGVFGTYFVPITLFYYSLSLLAQARKYPKKDSKKQLDLVAKNLNKLRDWANFAPMNHQHKYYLMEAERCRIQAANLEAMEYYDSAIAGAKENGYTQEEALANELAAQFYLDWDKGKIAATYMQEAHYCYVRWGAKAKVKHLEKHYPQLLQASTAKMAASTHIGTNTTNNSNTRKDLDLSTVIEVTNTISSEIVLEKLLATLMDILVKNAGAQRGILILPSSGSLFVEATKEAGSEDVSILRSHNLPGRTSIPLEDFEQLSSTIVHYVAHTGETVVLNNATREGHFTDDIYIQQHQCQSIACAPFINRGQLQGIIYLENNLTTGAFTHNRLALLRTLAAQAAISLENARLYEDLKTLNQNLQTLNVAYDRFVPAEFLSFLGKESIIDVKLGDQVEREMTVLFSDIRDFTTFSEQMTPTENFVFINQYLGYMEPQIQGHGGFIDKYIGDAIMALFPNSADDAVRGAIAMLEELKKYNKIRQEKALVALRIGIGLHTGRLMLGTVGGFRRMDGTAIGDAVNLSSRVEELTKTYSVSFLITHKTLANLDNPLEYDLRFIEQVKAKGKTRAVGLFEVFSADPPELRVAKIATKAKFEKAVLFYHRRSFEAAARLFQDCINYHADDCAARSYLERCHQHTV